MGGIANPARWVDRGKPARLLALEEAAKRGSPHMEISELSAAVLADNPLHSFHPLRASVPKLEAQHVLNMGATKLHDEVALGKLDGVRNGTRLEITVESIKRLQASMPRATFKPPAPPRMGALDRLHAKQRQLAAQRRTLQQALAARQDEEAGDARQEVSAT